MLTQNELKYYSSLHQKKIRRKEKKFIVEGQRLIDEALNSELKFEVLIINEGYQKKTFPDLSKHKKNIRIEQISDKKFLKLCDTESPQGIVAVLNIPVTYLNISDNENLIVALDNISDPGNVGTIIRTCDWFGIKNIIVSNGSVDVYNPKVIRSTMGSIFNINVHGSSSLINDLMDLKSNGWTILCSDMDGENIFKQKEKKRSVLVLNNEAHGPSDEVTKIADKIITIPKFGNAESLNVASAAAIMVAELSK